MGKRWRGTGFTCIFCDKYFKPTTDKNIHIRRHIHEKPYNCKLCDFSAACPTDLNLHVRRVHPPSTQKFQCSRCPKVFTNIYTLKHHYRDHHVVEGIVQHKCDFCGKMFKVKRRLIEHRRTHTGERPYKCSTCGMGFTQMGNYKVHLGRHERGEKRFSCQICPRRFNTKQSCLSHQNGFHQGLMTKGYHQQEQMSNQQVNVHPIDIIDHQQEQATLKQEDCHLKVEISADNGEEAILGI